MANRHIHMGSFPGTDRMTGGGGRGLPHPPKPLRAQRAGAPPVDREAGGRAIPGVSGRLNRLLASDSAYMRQAAAEADRDMNRRGLLNSSIATGAAQSARIAAALPIAQGDAEIAAGARGLRHAARESALDRGLTRSESRLGREFAREERLGGEAFARGERLGGEAFARGERQEAQTHATGLQTAEFQQRRMEQDKSIAAEKEIQSANRAMREKLAFEGWDRADAQAEADRMSREKIARNAARDTNNDTLMRVLTALASNRDIPVEERHRLEAAFTGWASGRLPVDEGLFIREA